jgi:tetratricopeptide (TPR) repeat protein
MNRRYQYHLAAILVAILCVILGVISLVLHHDVPSNPESANYSFFAGIGDYSRKVTTTSPAAQRYFDQGLAFLYGFNHEEAMRSFRAASIADRRCAMAYWGMAAACGPDINDLAVPPPRVKIACEALGRARELIFGTTPAERGLIEATAKQFADPAPKDRKALDEAYASAMSDLRKAFPDDPDIGALRAQALMVLRPRDQWTPRGKPKPGTEEILQTIDAVLAKSPKHLLALHLLIHALESSPHPEKAAVAADTLRDLSLGIGHLVHMPSHIDVHLGRWQNAVIANEKAITADHAYRRIEPGAGSHLTYMSHNHHMLAFAAMMQGQSKKATLAVEEMLGQIPEGAIEADRFVADSLFAMPYEINLRFGRWDSMLAEPRPRANLPFATAMWHCARGVAFAAKMEVDKAKEEQREFWAAKVAIQTEPMRRTGRLQQMLATAEKMLNGEILYREGRTQEAIAALHEAIRLEDELHDWDPPIWLLPVRHALGATLMDARRYAEAETVYKEDLARLPENGWSLYGLSRSLQMQRKTAEAAATFARFEKSWQYADVKLTSSCCCLPGHQ